MTEKEQELIKGLHSPDFMEGDEVAEELVSKLIAVNAILR